MPVIEMPRWAVPNGASPSFMDFGAILRPSTGAEVLRVDRLGSRYKARLSFPPFDDVDQGRVIVSRLIRAKRAGLRIEYPLMCPQPLQDAVVDGAGQAGTTLNIRGLTSGMVVREGFWLNVVRSTGQHFLHNVGGEVIADGSGRVALPLSEMLRRPFVDGDKVKLVQPMIEGLVDGDEQAWSLSIERFVGIEFTVEEAA
ncbi:MAG: hypothetical protein GY736_05090 [Sphingomonas sp.]|uniref:hypothetical protein n=1 Tax=Sphingomonas sp. TaxID=28214 RepID=UPI00258E95CD|nr:hypothetical protein [Sphingomonas sp.]MCP4025673.1 hypothetical protein [Sphingomonas sp.]